MSETIPTTANYENVFIVGTGAFLPGEAVTNAELDAYIAPLNAQSSRIKSMILRENGIERRYYGIDPEGRTRFSLAEMGAESSRRALAAARTELGEIELLATGTVGGDTAVPGYANMLQGELHAPPMETSSHTGICASGMVALRHAADAVELGRHARALVTATEYPSRMFKKTRFVEGYDVDFDSHFLRWMLSDGSGSFVLADRPRRDGLSLKVSHLHVRSFSGDYPTCMQIGAPLEKPGVSYLDYPTFADAERDGAFLLRQNIRLLPQLFEVAAHEYVELIRRGVFRAEEIDHFLCHFSSMKFAPVVKELLVKAGADIADEKWYSNLVTRGNTGSASIFIMLDDFLRERTIKPGEKILCLIPESARISICYLLLEVVEGTGADTAVLPAPPSEGIDSPDEATRRLLQDLSLVWHDYRSRFWRSKFFRKASTGTLTPEDYRKWTASWIPQVREGSKWMRTAAGNLAEPFLELKELIQTHAGEEQNDWQILFQDYRNAGGSIEDPDRLERNRGGEALNAFMFSRAARTNAVDLLGGIYIIEGTGQRIIPALLPLIKTRLGLAPNCFKFLQYHGTNDEHHLARWLGAVGIALSRGDPERVAAEILATARTVADLYLMQLEDLDL
ncbi:MAG: hypothetical protein JST04_04480 [Bdellovibrionales bacterium]|nr:hypothetical protein [Bdellovibrionales bacterium]